MRTIPRMIFALAVATTYGSDLTTIWGPRAAFQITFRLVDDQGQPVEGAKLGCSWGRIGFAAPDVGQASVLTDSDGKAVVAGHSVFDVFNYHGEKLGYYSSGSIEYDQRVFRERVNGRWEPWNPTIEIVLKGIRNPVPMYARRLAARLPALNTPIGYDLEFGDWLPPQGKGRTGDLVFLGKLDQRNNENWDWELTVSFANRGDGLQRFEPQSANGGSELRSPHEAPADGYQSTWTLFRRRRPGILDETNFRAEGGYFFRVRTELDAQGHVVKAWYGKIYGDFFDMVYYLNPDGTRNVEFDPKRNLFHPRDDRDSAFWNLGP